MPSRRNGTARFGRHLGMLIGRQFLQQVCRLMYVDAAERFCRCFANEKVAVGCQNLEHLEAGVAQKGRVKADQPTRVS
jgi:hypothetical protein